MPNTKTREKAHANTKVTSKNYNGLEKKIKKPASKPTYRITFFRVLIPFLRLLIYTATFGFMSAQ